MNDIRELITRRRHQLLIHSCLYYRMNENIITDHTFDLWSNELVELQKKHPDTAKQCIYHEYFEDFDGSSGYNLPYHLPRILNAATTLLRVHKRFKEEGRI